MLGQRRRAQTRNVRSGRLCPSPTTNSHYKTIYARLEPNYSPRLSFTAISIILLRTKIAFRGLDGGVPEQKLDLLQIPAILAAELGAGAAQVMGAEVLDPNLLR